MLYAYSKATLSTDSGPRSSHTAPPSKINMSIATNRAGTISARKAKTRESRRYHDYFKTKA